MLLLMVRVQKLPVKCRQLVPGNRDSPCSDSAMLQRFNTAASLSGYWLPHLSQSNKVPNYLASTFSGLHEAELGGGRVEGLPFFVVVPHGVRYIISIDLIFRGWNAAPCFTQRETLIHIGWMDKL